MVDVVVTPSSDGRAILSQLATSDLRLPRCEALNGIPKLYWQVKGFYSFYGVSSAVSVSRVMSVLDSLSVSVALDRATTLDRVTACMDYDSVISRPTMSLSTRHQAPNEGEEDPKPLAGVESPELTYGSGKNE